MYTAGCREKPVTKQKYVLRCHTPYRPCFCKRSPQCYVIANKSLIRYVTFTIIFVILIILNLELIPSHE